MKMRERLYQQSAKLQKYIVPELKYSQDYFEEVLSPLVTVNTDWLDLGCGHCVLPVWRHDSEAALVKRSRFVVGLDYDMLSLRKHKTIEFKVRGDISFLPFPDGSMNLVTANMVVEHLDNPQIQFNEVFRVLRPGGKFIFHTMNARGYYTACARLIPGKIKEKLVLFLQEREEEDLFETHYLANTHKDILRLSKEAGLRDQREIYINSFPQFRILPPLVLFELLWIKLLMMKPFQAFRTNMIVILEK